MIKEIILTLVCFFVIEVGTCSAAIYDVPECDMTIDVDDAYTVVRQDSDLSLAKYKAINMDAKLMQQMKKAKIVLYGVNVEQLRDIKVANTSVGSSKRKFNMDGHSEKEIEEFYNESTNNRKKEPFAVKKVKVVTLANGKWLRLSGYGIGDKTRRSVCFFNIRNNKATIITATFYNNDKKDNYFSDIEQETTKTVETVKFTTPLNENADNDGKENVKEKSTLDGFKNLIGTRSKRRGLASIVALPIVGGILLYMKLKNRKK